MPNDTPSDFDGSKLAELPSRPKRILLVEDDGGLIELLADALRMNDYEVECATDGKVALELILESDFNVIVCDMMMPRLSGDMFYLAVQRVKPHLCPRFLFMTGYKGEEKIDYFIRRIHGILIWKPFKTDELLDAVQLILETTGDARA